MLSSCNPEQFHIRSSFKTAVKLITIDNRSQIQLLFRQRNLRYNKETTKTRDREKKCILTSSHNKQT